ncbi:MAG: hypothetical protein WAU02_04110 [Candidatus Saccharimonadales bacterium]
MKKFITQIKWLILAAMMISGVYYQSNVSAIDGESIVMSPVSKPYKLDAGTVRSDSFTIINDGTSRYTFKVYASPYSVTNRQYDASYEAQTPNADAYQWVTFQQSRYELKPGEKVEVPYTISVPKDAASGGHYCVLFAETEIDPASSGTQISRQKRVGAIVYATVKGDVIEAGRELTVRVDPIQIGYPLTGLMTIENTGNTDFTMKKTLQIKNILGGTVYDQTLEHIILPKTTRDLPLTWENGAWLGWYNVHTESVVLGKTVTHDQLVFIAPAWFIIVAAVAIAAVGYITWRRFRR